MASNEKVWSLSSEDNSVPYALVTGQIKVPIHAEHMHRNVELHVVQALREKIEGKYTQGSYIRRNSATLLKRSPLSHIQGDPRGTYVSTVDYVADRVALHPGDRIRCRIESVNKLSAMGRTGDYLEIKVYLPRDQYQNATFFDRPEMGVGASVAVEIMPSPAGAMNDEFVIVYGKIVALDGDTVTRDPEELPTRVQKQAPEISVPAASATPKLGETAPSMSIVMLAYQGHSWEGMLKTLLQRGAKAEDLLRGRRLKSPFADLQPLADRRFWWEQVQRTGLLQEDRTLSAAVFAGEASADILRHVEAAVTTLLGPSLRLPGTFHAIEVDAASHKPAVTAAFAVDPLLVQREVRGTELPSLADMVTTEAAWVYRILTALASVDPSGTLVCVMLPRPTHMMVDWMAWIGSFFRETTWLRPIAQDPLHPQIVTVFNGLSDLDGHSYKELLTCAQTWLAQVEAGGFVANLENSPASAAYVTAYTDFIERAQKLQLRSARDALRVWEDQPDAEEEAGLQEGVRSYLQQWSEVFRYPSEVPSVVAE